MSKIKQKIKKQKKDLSSPFKNYWDKSNYILLGIGMGIIVLGFILMAQDPWDNPLSLSVSPLVLLFAYLIVFPLSILYKKKKSSTVNNVSSED
jgi:Protein of unknown function (DUF3098)